MTLTELWKDGQLEDGFYYFRLPDGSIDIASEYRLIRYRLTKDADKIEVLAPVPSYEEWQELIDKKNWCNARAKNLLEKNQQLKELLGECKYFLAEYDNDFSWDDCVKGYHLGETINKIIGEKK